MQECNEADTPMVENPLLSVKDSPQIEQERKEMVSVPYREALGKLIYLATVTRPDISYAVGVLCHFSEDPGKTHWLALKHILQYLQKMTNYKLIYGLPSDLEELFVTHSDADLGGNVDNSPSTSGFVLSIGGGAVMWSSRLQHHTSLSSTESEYPTASATGCEMIWICELLDEVGYNLSSPSTLYVNNNLAIQVAKNPEHQSTMKHIHRSFHWIHEKVANGEIRVAHVPGAMNVTDIPTKPLGPVKFEQFTKMLELLLSLIFPCNHILIESHGQGVVLVIPLSTGFCGNGQQPLATVLCPHPLSFVHVHATSHTSHNVWLPATIHTCTYMAVTKVAVAFTVLLLSLMCPSLSL
jgi:hypothetical protein